MIGAMGCYMAALQLLAVSSPGVGPIGNLMLVLPGDLMEWMHAPAYGLLAWLAVAGLRHRGWPLSYALPVGLAFALVFGVWTEVAQGSVPGREPSIKDLLVNGIGIFLAGVWMCRRDSARGRRATMWSWPGLRGNGVGA